jgi:DNA-binding NarL/FixJ family response regulator
VILRVLVVDPDPEDLLFIEEVLLEIEEANLWRGWARAPGCTETIAATSCSEACAALAREPVDVILLNPDLNDTDGPATLRRIQQRAANVPVVLLFDRVQRETGIQMIREGAQDFLFKHRLDREPLAHAIQNAIERQKLIAAARASCMIDALTGLPNLEAFLSQAERDCRVAAELGIKLLFLAAEPAGAAALEANAGFNSQQQDFRLIEAAEFLREAAGASSLLARVSSRTFAAALFDTPGNPIQESWPRIHRAAFTRGIALGAAIFDPSESMTLEALLERAHQDLHAACCRPAIMSG